MAFLEMKPFASVFESAAFLTQFGAGLKGSDSIGRC